MSPGACSSRVPQTGPDGPEDGDAGLDLDAPANVVPPAERKRIFFLRNGTLGRIRDSADMRPALEVADEACTNEAQRLGLGGSWKAWLSSSSVDAIDRIADVGPSYRLDQETLLFASRAEFARGPRVRIDPSDEVEHSDVCMQFGSCVQTFWSGTAIDGRRTSDNCSDWTIYNRPAIATVGRADVAGEAWVVPAPLLCSAYLALLCIEQ